MSTEPKTTSKPSPLLTDVAVEALFSAPIAGISGLGPSSRSSAHRTPRHRAAASLVPAVRACSQRRRPKRSNKGSGPGGYRGREVQELPQVLRHAAGGSAAGFCARHPHPREHLGGARRHPRRPRVSRGGSRAWPIRFPFSWEACPSFRPLHAHPCGGSVGGPATMMTLGARLVAPPRGATECSEVFGRGGRDYFVSVFDALGRSVRRGGGGG